MLCLPVIMSMSKSGSILPQGKPFSMNKLRMYFGDSL
jgi:hypothetical protein